MTIRQRHALNLIFTLYALLTLARAISNVAQTYGAGDLYVYWYAGHFVREQRNPYLAYLNDESPTVPVSYLDGATFTALPKPWIVPFSPLTNTSPYVLLISLLSNFNWFVAKWSFFILNVFLAIIMPHIALQAFDIHWSRTNQVTLHLLFFSTIGTRTTIVNSQNALLILLVMLLTLKLTTGTIQIRPWLIGILLGLALSKISLVIAACLLLLALRRITPLLIAASVQLIALIGLSVWTNSNPLATLNAHLQIFRSVAAFDGIHLGYLLPNATPFIVGGTLILFGWIGWWVFQNYTALQQTPTLQQHLFTIFALWSLLFAYHGPYDAVLLLPVFLFLIKSHTTPQPSNNNHQKASIVTSIPQAILIMGCVLLLLPGNIDLANQLTTPAWWPQMLPKLIAFYMLVLFMWAVALLQKERPVQP